MKYKSRIALSNLVILLALCSASCSLMYTPTVHNVPMLTQKGELQATGVYSSPMNFEIHSAYAVSGNIGVMLNGSYQSNKLWDKKASTYYEAPNLSSEIGVGYFKKFDRSAQFEIYGGGGSGTIHGEAINPITSEFGAVSGNMIKFFIQPAIGNTFKPSFLPGFEIECDMALRFTGVNMFNETKYFAEPCFVIKYGTSRFRFVSSGGYSLQLHKSKTNYWTNNPYIFGVGIQAKFGLKPFFKNSY